MKNQLGITVDIVKQVSGTTNDGNMARRFFEDPEIVAKITGVDAILIKRIAVILQVHYFLDIDIKNSQIYLLSYIGNYQ